MLVLIKSFLKKYNEKKTHPKTDDPNKNCKKFGLGCLLSYLLDNKFSCTNFDFKESHFNLCKEHNVLINILSGILWFLYVCLSSISMWKRVYQFFNFFNLLYNGLCY